VSALARTMLTLLVALAFGVGHAHAFLVLGELRLEPDPPRPGEALSVTVTMADPSLAPVEDAVVFLELRRQRLVGDDVAVSATETPDLPPPDSRVDLTETEPGVYRGQLTAPAAGVHHVLVRDQTFQWEEANASVMIELDGRALGTLPFILPPTAIGPRSLWVWLLWLIGVPLLAGLVVTALVLGSRSPANESEATPPA